MRGIFSKIRELDKKLHDNVLEHQYALDEIKNKHIEDIKSNQKEVTKALELKNDEITSLLREKDDLKVQHAKVIDGLNASLNKTIAERDRCRAAEETMRIAASERLRL